ncbi:MAG: hypothetical protein R3F14_33790 [Polyangiaceae bacterium]
MIKSVGEQKTPLEERLEFGKIILWVCPGLSAVLLAWGSCARRRALSVAGGGASLAVAAIPGGAAGDHDDHARARDAADGAARGDRAEAAGGGDAGGGDDHRVGQDRDACAERDDLQRRFTGGHVFRPSGEGYDPAGDILERGREKLEKAGASSRTRSRRRRFATTRTSIRTGAETKQVKIVGDPTEGALLTRSRRKGKMPREAMLLAHELIAELPFDSDRKRSDGDAIGAGATMCT